MSTPPKRIHAQTLKGFRDYPPDKMLIREHLVDTARRVYRSYGFRPIDTPALEYSEILLGKGGEESDKQLFRFLDQGGRDVALRFDLTVPFARFAAQHLQEIGTPFKRYHIGTVWRAEKPQRGRFREFLQCDFDTLGTESNAADTETLLVIHDLFNALGFSQFKIRVNNRRVLNGLLEKIGATEHAVGILRSLDKLAKIGREAVFREMTEQVGVTPEQANSVMKLAEVHGDSGSVLDQLESLLDSNATGLEGVAQLRELTKSINMVGIPSERVELDVSIARGLDYYTGTIYETVLLDLPTIGSVCSGGRYDDLAGLFTNQRLPGVGASLGLDRLLAAFEELGVLDSMTSPIPVLVTMFDANRIGDYLRVGNRLRQAGLETEVFADTRSIGKQLKYADRRGFRVAVIAGEQEFADHVWQVKDLLNGNQTHVPESDLAACIKELIRKDSAADG